MNIERGARNIEGIHAKRRKLTVLTRAAKGAVCLDGFQFNARALQRDLAGFKEEDWSRRPQGAAWADMSLLRRGPGGEVVHPRYARCGAIRAVVSAFAAKPIDVLLARLNPGGRIKEHRDFSGSTPMGVTRFHIPITTHGKVDFRVSGTRVGMRPGSVWHLDTSYLHSVANDSQRPRVHLIVDFETNPAIRRMLPPLEFADVLHRAHFFGLCAVRGSSLMFRDPRQVLVRVRSAIELRIHKRSIVDLV